MMGGRYKDCAAGLAVFPVLAAGLLIAALAIGRFCALPEEEPPIDHELDADRAAQVRALTSKKAPAAAEELRVWIGDERCCMECDGHMVCASAVECGGVACRGRDVKIPLPCGALAFCGEENR